MVLNGVRIILEGRKPSQWERLTERGFERLDNNLCDLCIIVEYTDVKIESLAPTQLDIRKGLLNGQYKVGFLSYVNRIGLEKWIGIKPPPEVYENISFDELLTQIMTAYTRVVREDLLEPVIQKMSDVVMDFGRNISATVNIDRLRTVLEFKQKEEEEND